MYFYLHVKNICFYECAILFYSLLQDEWALKVAESLCPLFLANVCFFVKW